MRRLLLLLCLILIQLTQGALTRVLQLLCSVVIWSTCCCCSLTTTYERLAVDSSYLVSRAFETSTVLHLLLVGQRS